MGNSRHRGCPYHAAEAQLGILPRRFAPQADQEDSLPLFPDVNAEHISSDIMAKVVDDLAGRIGEEVIDSDGDKVFGNHSWRTGGSVYLTSIGLDPFKINLLARWRSPLITHYSKLAPLKALTEEFKRAASERTSSTVSPSSRSDKLIDKRMATKVLKTIECQLQEYEQRFTDLQDMITKVKNEASKKYVINRKTRLTHKILAGYEQVGPKAITFCGWPYAQSKVTITHQEPTKASETCDTCMPALRSLLVLGID